MIYYLVGKPLEVDTVQIVGWLEGVDNHREQVGPVDQGEHALLEGDTFPIMLALR